MGVCHELLSKSRSCPLQTLPYGAHLDTGFFGNVVAAVSLKIQQKRCLQGSGQLLDAPLEINPGGDGGFVPTASVRTLIEPLLTGSTIRWLPVFAAHGDDFVV
jgi:hypothetical protein